MSFGPESPCIAPPANDIEWASTEAVHGHDEMSTTTAAQTKLTLVVNGEPAQVASATLAALLDEMGFGGLKVATALNGDFVPERRRMETRLAAGDRIEVVAPRQGG